MLKLYSLFVATLLLVLSGCATVQTAYDAVGKPETLSVCGAADVLTTAAVVSTGHGVEANPLLAPSVNAHHFLPMVLSKAAIVGVIWWIYNYFKPNPAAKAGVAVATTVTCGAAVHNALLLR